MAVTLTEPGTAKAATLTGAGEMTFFSFPIEKTETTPDGDVVVYGKATDGTLDSDLQIVDPDWSRKAIQEWFDTGGNVRVQHNASRDPAGKGIQVDGHYVKALVVEPVAQRLVKAGVLQDFSVGIMNPDIRVRDPHFKHLDPAGKAVNGVITGRPDGMSKIGEISLVDRGSNFGTRFAMVKAAASGEPEWVGELTAPDEVLAKVAKPSGKTVTVELPKNVSVSFSPKDLAKLVAFKQTLTEGVTKAPNDPPVMDAAMLAAEPAGDDEGDDIDDDTIKTVKAAEVTVYKRDVSTAERRDLRSQGRALDNLSYPVKTHEDADNAATLILSGHGDVAAARKMLTRIARKEGWTDILDRLKGGKKRKAGKVAEPQAGKKMKVMCGACGAKQNRKHAVCSECGKPLANAMAVTKNHDFTCLGCGKELDKGEKFCPHCGKQNPGYLPEADRKIPANEDASKAAKGKGKKKKPGKGNPFGGKQSPPFGKDKDGDDDDATKAGKGRVTKGKKGKGKTPGQAGAVPGSQREKPAGRHREPDGAAIEAFEDDAHMQDGDNEHATHTEELVGSHKAADPEVAAALHLSTLGVPADTGALHALTCPAYALADVAKAFPHATFAGIDLSTWQNAALTKAASAPLDQARDAMGIYTAATALKGAGPDLLTELRAQAHKMFTDANPGPATFPTPSELAPARFNRPYLTAGHSAPSPDHDGPNDAKLPPSGGIVSEDYTRPYLAAGHAADAPENTHPTGPMPPPTMTGVPTSGPARQFYTNAARDGASHAMQVMHDHIAHTFPGLCPMGADEVGRHPVPTPQGVPDVSPAPVKKKNAKAKARKAAKAKARKAAARRKARERKLTAQVMKGLITVDDARVKLGRKPVTSEPVTKAATPEAPEAPAVLDADTLQAALKAATRPLLKKIGSQDKVLRKQRKQIKTIAAQPDTSHAPFRGAALTKNVSAPAAPTATGLAEQAQVSKMKLLWNEYLTATNPELRETAYREYTTLLGINP